MEVNLRPFLLPPPSSSLMAVGTFFKNNKKKFPKMFVLFLNGKPFTYPPPLLMILPLRK